MRGRVRLPDYKVQGRTLGRVALELRGTRSTVVNGEAVPGQCMAAAEKRLEQLSEVTVRGQKPGTGEDKRRRKEE